MKLKQIVITTGLALVTGQALAAVTFPLALDIPEIYASGSSAQQTSLGKIVEAMCQTPTVNVFYDNGATPGNNHRAYYCTTKTTLTPASIAGKKVLFNNRASGGSAYGVNPVADGLLIAKMTVDSTCAATGNVYPVVPQYTCANTVNAIPDAGVSDVEPNIFVPINLPPAFPNKPTYPQTIAAATYSEAAVGYGIALTDSVLNAPASQLNLTRSQVTSMLTGSYQTWDSINASLAGKPVIICRRAPGSGSQAAMNAYFNGVPCLLGSAIQPFDHTANTVTNGSAYTVIENGTTGGVISCMNAANNGGPVTVTEPNPVVGQPPVSVTYTLPAGSAAIGIIGLEKTRGAADKWNFAKLDGIDANMVNAANGSYDFYVEQTIQWRTVAVPGVPAATALAGAKLAFMSKFKDLAGDPTVLAGIPGVAALPTNGWDPSLYPAGSVMKGSRLTNTCSPSQLYF